MKSEGAVEQYRVSVGAVRMLAILEASEEADAFSADLPEALHEKLEVSGRDGTGVVGISQSNKPTIFRIAPFENATSGPLARIGGFALKAVAARDIYKLIELPIASLIKIHKILINRKALRGNLLRELISHRRKAGERFRDGEEISAFLRFGSSVKSSEGAGAHTHSIIHIKRKKYALIEDKRSKTED